MTEPNELHRELAEMKLRLDLLERENQRLREKLEPVFGPDNPCFDPNRFRKTLTWILLPLISPVWLFGFIPLIMKLVSRSAAQAITRMHIGPFPVFDFGRRVPGVGLGLVAFGGLSIGVIAFGGLAIGLIAVGGGAFGLIAIGGGSFGLIAIGGGAIGYIAIGGGAIGRYALGQRGLGKSVFALNRQDPEAIEFFTRFFPWLRNSVTTAMPVLPAPTTHAN